jgi:hypothetical protein
MKKLSIGVDFERAAARGNQGQRFDPLSQLENFGRQTDGLRRVVSNDAVFDRHLEFHSSSFPDHMVSALQTGVKEGHRVFGQKPACSDRL